MFCPTQGKTKDCFQLLFINNVAGVKERWDLCRQVLTSYDDSVSTVALSPDGRMLVSALYDNTERL